MTTPRVGELEPHGAEVVAGANLLAPLADLIQQRAQLADGLLLVVEEQLVGVGASVGLHGVRLSAPDQGGAAAAEAAPAPQGQVGR